MGVVFINEPELFYIELFRVALSETTDQQRQKAIMNAKHEVIAKRLELLIEEGGGNWIKDPVNAKLVQWITKTSPKRQEAAIEFAETGRRYEDKSERKLNVAEHIGRLIWHSIQDGNFEGVQTDTGILQQVRDEAKEYSISGARDKDTLRGIWNTYRGVAHLGMAIDYCDNNPSQRLNVLHLAELFRRALSENCPKGRSKPYVDPREQFSFVYSSKLWGPRYQDRGLPYDIG